MRNVRRFYCFIPRVSMWYTLSSRSPTGYIMYTHVYRSYTCIMYSTIPLGFYTYRIYVCNDLRALRDYVFDRQIISFIIIEVCVCICTLSPMYNSLESFSFYLHNANPWLQWHIQGIPLTAVVVLKENITDLNYFQHSPSHVVRLKKKILR